MPAGFPHSQRCSFRQCAEILKRELDTVPEPATTALYHEASNALSQASDRDSPTAAFDAMDGFAESAETAPASAPVDQEPRASLDATPDAGRRASVAVLPFVNIGGDPEQEVFTDGFTEDIITDLSRFRTLQVATRSASFRLRQQGADAKHIGRILDVDYLVLGSVRRHGARMRLTAQLVHARSNSQLWADRFDRDGEDVFAVADELVHTIAATLAGRVLAAGSELAKRKPPTSLAAYECVLRANAAQMQVGDPQAEDEMRRFYEKAVALDPGYGWAHAALALAHLRAWFRDTSGSDAALDSAVELARKSLALDPNDSECQETLGWILLHRKSFELAEQYCWRALELNPISPDDLASMGALCSFQGRPEEGIRWFAQAKQVDSFFDPTWYWQLLGAPISTRADMTRRSRRSTAARADRPGSMLIWRCVMCSPAVPRRLRLRPPRSPAYVPTSPLPCSQPRNHTGWRPTANICSRACAGPASRRRPSCRLRGYPEQSLVELEEAVDLRLTFATGHYRLTFVRCRDG